MNILGISCFYHDSAAALISDGKIIAAAQEERFTRKKHDSRFPASAVNFCLEKGGLKVEDIDYVAFYDKPFIKFERILETYLSYAPRGLVSFLTAMPVWIKEKLWISQLIEKEMPGFKGKLLYPEHHQSHASSAFFPSPFEDAAFLTVDGVGEWATTSFGVGEGNSLRIMSEIHFPHSLGLLYSAFTYYLGFRVNSGEYKVMGLAPYGTPKYADLIRDNLIDIKDDGSFRLNMKFFNYCTGLTMTNSKFSKLFGQPVRTPETQLEQFHMDVAASLQVVTEEVVLKIARHIRKVTGKNKLCLAGGVALNCVANGKIISERIFDDVWIQPAAGDAGGALGAAMLGWYEYLGNERTAEPGDAQRASLLGPEFSEAEIEKYLTENSIKHTKYTKEETPAVVAKLLDDQKVVGWFSGPVEFGPRALGSRSILGDARSTSMQSDINLKVKFRESFRPFAPAVLEEESGKWFEIGDKSPYMLVVSQVRKDCLRDLEEVDKNAEGFAKLRVNRSKIPAITHVDNSARLQTVGTSGSNPQFRRVIEEFNSRTGTPIIINTSFNVRGEPIVCSPEEAYKCFMRTDIDFLVLENFVIDKTLQPKMERDTDWRKEYVLD